MLAESEGQLEIKLKTKVKIKALMIKQTSLQCQNQMLNIKKRISPNTIF